MKALWLAGFLVMAGCAVGTESTEIGADTTSVRGDVVADDDPAQDQIGTTSAASVDVGALKGSKTGTAAKSNHSESMDPQPQPWTPTKTSTGSGSSGSGSSSSSGSSQKP